MKILYATSEMVPFSSIRGAPPFRRMVIDPADIKPVGKLQIPRKLVMRDLREKTQTTLQIRDIRVDAPLDDSLFDPKRLKDQKLPPVHTE